MTYIRKLYFIFLNIILIGNVVFLYLLLPENLNLNTIMSSPEIRELWVPLKDKVSTILEVVDISSYFIPNIGSDIEQYDIKLNSKNLLLLLNSIHERKEKNILSKKYFNGDLLYKDKAYRIQIRVRWGQTETHYAFKKKSYKIKFLDPFPKGIRGLEFIIIRDKQYITEATSLYLAKKMGLIVPQFWFGNLTINGDRHGLYFISERLDDKMLEKNKLQNGNLYVDNGGADLNTEAYNRNSKVNYPINHHASINKLLNIMKDNNIEHFKKQIGSILDIEDFIRWSVHANLMGTSHQMFAGNLRLYFDPTKGQFRHIIWNTDSHLFPSIDFQVKNELALKLMRIPEFRLKRNQLLWKYVANDKALIDLGKFYDDTYNNIKYALFSDSKKKDSNLLAYLNIKLRRGYLSKNFILKRKEILKENVTVGIHYFNHEFKTVPDKWKNLVAKIEIKNNTPSEMFIDNIKVSIDKHDGKLLLLDEKRKLVAVAKYNYKKNAYIFDDLMLLVPVAVDENLHYNVSNTRLWIKYLNNRGEILKLNNNNKLIKLKLTNAITMKRLKPRTYHVDESAFSDLDKISQSQIDFIKQHQIFKINKDNEIYLPKDEYLITKTIVVPKKLRVTIKAGTKLVFYPKTSFISYGRVIAVGTRDKPIVFTAANNLRGRGVVAVIGKLSNNSRFANCIFEFGNEAYINGTYITGGFAAHFSDNLTINDTQVKESYGEDAVNIKNSIFFIDGMQIYNNKNDGMDLDFSSGYIKNSKFSNNGNDGLDLNMSIVNITNSIFMDNKDKGISVGERSSVVLSSSDILRNDIGVAIKDDSNIMQNTNNFISNNVGIESYQKKSIFGPSRTVLEDVKFSNNNTNFLTHDNSKIIFR
jgi:hypothetical protein